MSDFYKKSSLIYAALIILIQVIFLLQPISGSHKWRQADTAAVARNFALESANIFYPRVDVREDKTGITGMEFPLYQYITSLFFKAFKSDSDQIPKTLSFVFTGLFIFLLSLILKQHFGIERLLSIPILLSSPMLIEYGTKVLPDPLALLCLALSFFFYFKASKKKYWGIVFFSLTILIRPYLILWGFWFLYDFYVGIKKRREWQKPLLYGLLSLIPFMAWYFYWNPYLRSNFGMPHYFNVGLNIKENFKYFLDINVYLFFIKTSFKNYIGWFLVPSALLSLFIMRKSFFMLLLAFLIMIIIISGNHFIVHNYYLYAFLPLLLFGVLKRHELMKYKFERKKSVLVFLLLLLINGISSKTHFLTKSRYYQNEWSDEFISQVKIKTKETDLFVVPNRGSFPYHLYSVRRRGWSVAQAKLSDINYLRNLKKKGAKWAILLNNQKPQLLDLDSI